MSSTVTYAISESAEAFLELVWPIMAKYVGGRLLPIETDGQDESKKALDTLAGIDAWYILDGVGMHGVASRVQWVSTSYDTFTIRYGLPSGGDTEWQKRVRALREGYEAPYWTAQGYAALPKSENRLLNAGFTLTTTLYEYAEPRVQWPAKVYRETGALGRRYENDGVWLNINPEDKHVFVCVRWASMGLKSAADLGHVVGGQAQFALES